MARRSSKLRAAILTIAISIAATLAAGYFVAPWLGLIAALVGFFTLVARLDNEQGNFLPFAILFVIACLITMALMALMAVVMGRGG